MLEVSELSVRRRIGEREVAFVDGVSLRLERGETLALVGESGSGKTLTALALLRLLPAGMRFQARAATLDNVDLLSMGEDGVRRLRGDRLAMIFQEPMTSLDPLMRVGEQIGETLELHRGLSRRAARERAIRLLEGVGVPDPGRRVDAYPHELSGGMRQRALIAMALACEPAVLIADEPTTALDVTVQAQVLDLLRSQQKNNGMGLLLITHDLGVVAEIADRVCVMYSGRIVESAPVGALFDNPAHPYTQALLRGLLRLESPTPDAESDSPESSRARLPVIPGEPPRPIDRPSGCAFHPRCFRGAGEARCMRETPTLEALDAQRSVACWFAG